MGIEIDISTLQIEELQTLDPSGEHFDLHEATGCPQVDDMQLETPSIPTARFSL